MIGHHVTNLVPDAIRPGQPIAYNKHRREHGPNTHRGISLVFLAAIYRVILSDSRSSDSRIAMMDQAILVIERHPVLGVGLGGYNKAAQTAIPSSWAALSPDFRDS